MKSPVRWLHKEVQTDSQMESLKFAQSAYFVRVVHFEIQISSFVPLAAFFGADCTDLYSYYLGHYLPKISHDEMADADRHLGHDD